MGELDAWAYGLAQKFAPVEDENGNTHWKNEGDELRFFRFMTFCGKCAAARAQFESPRYAAIAVANQEGQKIPDIYKQDPYKVMDDIIDRWFAAAAAERAEKALDITPTPELEPEPVAKPDPDDDNEQSILWRAGIVTGEERLDLEAEWRREFERAHSPHFSATERRAHYRWADIPRELVEAWTAERKRSAKTPREILRPDSWWPALAFANEVDRRRRPWRKKTPASSAGAKGYDERVVVLPRQVTEAQRARSSPCPLPMMSIWNRCSLIFPVRSP